MRKGCLECMGSNSDEGNLKMMGNEVVNDSFWGVLCGNLSLLYRRDAAALGSDAEKTGFNPLVRDDHGIMTSGAPAT
jgi:hypothetical protein